MFKFILIMLFVIGTVTTVPPVRNRVLPALEPLIVKLGPIGEKMITPVRKYQAQTGATNALRELSQQRTQGREIPNVRTFSSWLQRAMRNDSAAFDPWGERYYLRTARGTVSVGSPGPDRKKETSDDIIVTVPWD